jgi:hypothetical protein
MATLLLLIISAGPDWLVPDLDLYAAQVRALEAKLGQAEAIEIALARVQNQLAERLRVGRGHCQDAEGQSLVARSRVFGPALRDAVQAARAEEARVRALQEAATIAPLIDDRERARVRRLAAAVKSSHRKFLVSAEWQRRFVERQAPCHPSLATAPGLPEPDGDPPKAPVAVIGIGGGRVCPAGVRAEGVIVLERPAACYGGEVCACTPSAILPGAVLGP